MSASTALDRDDDADAGRAHAVRHELDVENAPRVWSPLGENDVAPTDDQTRFPPAEYCDHAESELTDRSVVQWLRARLRALVALHPVPAQVR